MLGSLLKMSVDFVILAAGNGSRMHSSLPKFFQTVAGKPIIRYIIDACHELSHNVIVVTKDNLKGSKLFSDISISIQKDPLGTADAVKSSLPLLNSDYTVILCGDMPFIESEHLKSLIESKDENVILSMKIPDKFSQMPYGRVILKNSKFEKIIEYKDASNEDKKCPSANTGIYKIKTDLLKKYLPKIKKNANSMEFYLTDIFEIMKKDGIEISVIESSEYWPFHGINTMQDLALAEQIVQNQLRKKFMDLGVMLIAPETVYFSHDTKIASDVLIEPNVFIGNNVKIGKGSKIHAFSHIENCEIMNNVEIGPFARLRGNSVFMSDSSVGNFVEVKGSVFGEKTKAKHLSYIGDSTIGNHTNIGAGTITCNYDGVKKYKTQIGDDVFVGSNSTLIAPITISDGALIGAGSVITKNVENDALAISRARQIEVTNGAKKIWKKKGKIKNN